jgi:selenocysteine lyase/cysteine desulfurase
MPDYLPERIEAGTPNVHGIAGLAEGIRYVLMRGTDSILEHEREFAGRVIEGLEMMPLVKVYGSRRFYCQTGILSISLRNGDCETVAECLARKGVSVRAGLHCAPLAHRSACTLKTGTLRISPSCFTKLKDASILLRALRECLY